MTEEERLDQSGGSQILDVLGEMNWAVDNYGWYLRVMRPLLIHIRNKYEEKRTEVQGLSPRTLQCLEKSGVEKKWRREESPYGKLQAFLQKTGEVAGRRWGTKRGLGYLRWERLQHACKQVFYLWGCHNKVPQAERLKQQRCISSQLWRPGFCSVGSAGLLESIPTRCEGSHFLLASSRCLSSVRVCVFISSS